MSRRTSAAFAFVGIILAVHWPAVLGSVERPNILFLMVDEMDGRVLDDQSPQFKPPMPHLRALMREGAYFPQAYTSSPQCVPARSSMLAGRHNSKIRQWDNFVGIASINGNVSDVDPHCIAAYSKEECLGFAKDQDVNGTFIDALASAGYNVTLWGKMHAGAGLDRFPGKIDAWPWLGKGASAKAAGEWSRATGITPSQSPPGLRAPDNVQRPAPGPLDYPTTKNCAELLRGGLFKSEFPQFLYCSLLVPHPPYRTNSTYMSKLPPLGNASVPNWRPKDEVHPSDAYTSKVKNFWTVDEVSASHVEHFRRVYFSMCIEADELLGQILSAFKQGRGDKPAYVIMLGDHGEHATENRQCGKNSMLEASARVPLMITGPGIPRGQRVSSLASLHDVYPTVLDMARVPVKKNYDLAGESLLPIAQGGRRQKEYVTAEYHSVFSGTGIFMVRSGDLKLVLYAPVMPGDKPWPPQLFNLSQDPWEHANQAESMPQEVERLSVLLAREIDMKAADAAKKEFDRQMFTRYWYQTHGGASGCVAAMSHVYGGFDKTRDAAKVTSWLGKPCGSATVTIV